ncbi:hypothetical protein [Indioceanicola profundi]|uniref:hypothetical protein n=1 Tax=Indioceanicola profundi TaxID=2220096 RepID=UPI0013C52C2B|nr:hypothetical protein [Indioceanicola profundi]
MPRDAEEIFDLVRTASAHSPTRLDPVASLREAAATIETANPKMAERLRFYADCAELGIDPRLAHDPLLFAMEVIARRKPEQTENELSGD